VSWRSVVIRNKCSLHVKDNQLVIDRAGFDIVTLPIEDIGVLLIDTFEVNLTVSVLARMAEYGGIIIGCGDNHTPAAISLPLVAHSRQTAIQRTQVELSKPFLKRCWKKIVKQKILNQAKILSLCDHRVTSDELSELAQTITSGDSTNVESNAARIYFRKLFGTSFIRGTQYEGVGAVNSHLNYGYAVIRSIIAQSIVNHGLLPAFGIHHHSELNPFNLADDIIEPFRPLVDLYVAGLKLSEEDGYELTPEDKAGLIALLHSDVKIKNKKYAAMYAVDLCVANYQQAVLSGNPTDFDTVPEIVPIREHVYE